MSTDKLQKRLQYLIKKWKAESKSTGRPELGRAARELSKLIAEPLHNAGQAGGQAVQS